MGVPDVSIQQITPQESKWWDLGACRGLQAAIFYPEDEVEAQAAKAVCDSCAVKTTCLDHALSFREKSGVWGGATERDRRRIIRQRRRTA
ncbi:MAG: WhiB family redox-sensing transcriptional regulator [Ilumatobacter sp.]|jgi:WhiB family redox-sensing transcriptional regulator